MEETGKFVLLLIYLYLVNHSLSQATEIQDCDAVAVVAVEARDHGLNVSLSPVVPEHSVDNTIVAELPGAAVAQPECGSDLGRCPLVCRPPDSLDDGPLCLFPVRINGTENFLSLVRFERSSSRQELQVKDKVFIKPKTASCVPLVVFEGGPEAPVQNLVPCLDLTSQAPFLYFEVLEDGFTLRIDQRWPNEYFPVNGDISRVLYGDSVNGGRGCSPPHNAFVKIGPKVHVFRIFADSADFHLAEAEIENCPHVADFQFFKPDSLYFKCSPDDAVLYDVCNSGKVEERLDMTVNASIYQCPDANLNVHHFQGNLTVEVYGGDAEDEAGRVFTLPFNDTTTAKCVGGQMPLLFLARSNGETHFLDLSTGELHFVASNTCGSHSCLELSVLKGSNLVVGVFDYSTNNYLVLNLACPSSPLVSRVYYTIPPARITVVASGGIQICSPCDKGPPITSSQTPTPSNSPVTTTSTLSPTTNSSEEPSVDRGSSLSLGGDVIGVTAAGSIVMFIAAVMVSVAVVVAVITIRKRNGSSQPPTPPNLQPAAVDDGYPEATCVSYQAHDVDGAGAMVSHANMDDRTRYGADQIVDNLAKRNENEDNANDFLLKVLAVEESNS